MDIKPERRAFLREVMRTAWSLYRSAAENGQPYQCFGQALKAGWRWVRSAIEFKRRTQGRQVRFSKDLIKSPAARSFGRNSGGDFSAAYLTAKLGR